MKLIEDRIVFIAEKTEKLAPIITGYVKKGMFRFMFVDTEKDYWDKTQDEVPEVVVLNIGKQYIDEEAFIDKLEAKGVLGIRFRMDINDDSTLNIRFHMRSDTSPYYFTSIFCVMLKDLPVDGSAQRFFRNL